jgi:quercetin dioxygenase-like cupin family protein
MSPLYGAASSEVLMGRGSALYDLPLILDESPFATEWGMAMTDDWKFTHNRASKAEWGPGRRKIFEYRDLGIKDATNGDYVAQVTRANGSKAPDDVQRWHRHHCDFQFLMVLQGWAEFEYEGEGLCRMEKGDVINQRPGIRHRELACSDDFEFLEIVSPADFKTSLAE